MEKRRATEELRLLGLLSEAIHDREGVQWWLGRDLIIRGRPGNDLVNGRRT